MRSWKYKYGDNIIEINHMLKQTHLIFNGKELLSSDLRERIEFSFEIDTGEKINVTVSDILDDVKVSVLVDDKLIAMVPDIIEFNEMNGYRYVVDRNSNTVYLKGDTGLSIVLNSSGRPIEPHALGLEY